MPLLIYCAAAVAFTWPLAWHPASLVGAPVAIGDPYLYLWTLGWVMQTWLTHPADLFTGRVFDANIFHPAAATLTYSDHLVLQSTVLMPVYAVTHNVVLCYNLLLLASLVASALAMHLFVVRLLGPTRGAYAAGLAWGFGSYHFAHLLHIQLQALYFLPLTFLLLWRVAAPQAAAPRRRDAILLGVVTALQAIASVYYAVIGGLALLVAALVMIAWPPRTQLLRRIGSLALSGIVAAALVLPIGVIYWRVQQEEGFGRNLYEASRSAAFVDSYAQVPPGNLLYGRTGALRLSPRPTADGVPHTGPERELFPGLTIVLLAIAGVVLGWRADARRLIVVMCAVGALGFVLSLGPDGVRPLYAAFHRYVFGFQAVRATARFSVLVMFALATLAALGWRELSLRVAASPRFRVLPALALVAIVAECAYLPESLAAAPPLHTDVGQWLARAPGSGAVAVLPLTLDVENTPAMVQSLEHRRPLVNGYSGQRPSFYAQLVDTLSTFPSGEALLALHDSGVQYVVTRDRLDRPAEESGWPLQERAHFADGTIYELTWTPEVEARFVTLTSVVPPPPGAVPFAPGEIARYAVTWDGAGVNVSAGEILLAVEAPAYRLVADARTAPWVTRFFEAQDRFVTTTDASLLPLVHERDQHEGARHVTRAFVYDAPAHRMRSGRTLADARGDGAVVLPLPDQSRDAIAALFYVRTLPMTPGTIIQLPVNEAGRNLVVNVQVGHTERVTVGGTSMTAIRLEPRLVQRLERRQAVTGTVWLSDDARRVPVKVELAAPYGHLVLDLLSYTPGS